MRASFFVVHLELAGLVVEEHEIPVVYAFEPTANAEHIVVYNPTRQRVIPVRTA